MYIRKYVSVLHVAPRRDRDIVVVNLPMLFLYASHNLNSGCNNVSRMMVLSPVSLKCKFKGFFSTFVCCLLYYKIVPCVSLMYSRKITRNKYCSPSIKTVLFEHLNITKATWAVLVFNSESQPTFFKAPIVLECAASWCAFLR